MNRSEEPSTAEEDEDGRPPLRRDKGKARARSRSRSRSRGARGRSASVGGISIASSSSGSLDSDVDEDDVDAQSLLPKDFVRSKKYRNLVTVETYRDLVKTLCVVETSDGLPKRMAMWDAKEGGMRHRRIGREEASWINRTGGAEDDEVESSGGPKLRDPTAETFTLWPLELAELEGEHIWTLEDEVQALHERHSKTKPGDIPEAGEGAVEESVELLEDLLIRLAELQPRPPRRDGYDPTDFGEIRRLAALPPVLRDEDPPVAASRGSKRPRLESTPSHSVGPDDEASTRDPSFDVEMPIDPALLAADSSARESPATSRKRKRLVSHEPPAPPAANGSADAADARGRWDFGLSWIDVLSVARSLGVSESVIASAASRLSTIYGPLPDPLPPLDFRTYHVVRRSAAPAKSGPETRGRKRRGEAFKSKEVIDDEDEEWAEGGQQ